MSIKPNGKCNGRKGELGLTCFFRKSCSIHDRLSQSVLREAATGSCRLTALSSRSVVEGRAEWPPRLRGRHGCFRRPARCQGFHEEHRAVIICAPRILSSHFYHAHVRSDMHRCTVLFCFVTVISAFIFPRETDGVAGFDSSHL